MYDGIQTADLWQIGQVDFKFSALRIRNALPGGAFLLEAGQRAFLEEIAEGAIKMPNDFLCHLRVCILEPPLRRTLILVCIAFTRCFILARLAMPR